MVSITIRDIPDDLFTEVKEMAQTERRSINSEVIEVLDHAVQQWRIRRQRAHLLEEITQLRESQPPSSTADTLARLREGREPA